MRHLCPQLALLAALAAGCGPSRQLQVNVAAGTCSCQSRLLEFYLVQGHSSCALASGSSANTSGEQAISFESDPGLHLYALVLAYGVGPAPDLGPRRDEHTPVFNCCCYAVGEVFGADALALSPSSACTIPTAELEKAGVPAALTMPIPPPPCH